MKQNASHHGFTLVELLVVISIIAILAGILLPAVLGAFKKATESQARTEVKSIEVAIKQYFAEYGKFPIGSGGSDVVYGSDNNKVMDVLRAVNSSTLPVTNPRKIVFIEVNEESLKNPANNQLGGTFWDPWGEPYKICYDANFDNSVSANTDGIGTIAGRNVLVWSLGSGGSGTNSLIKSW